MELTTYAPRACAAATAEAELMNFDGTKLLGLCLFFLVSAPAARAATYTVTNTGNGTGAGTLRRAISNANANAGADTIAFNVPAGSLTAGVAVFQISNQLDITDAGTTIDGTTQTTFAGNTNAGTLGVGGTVGVDSLALPTVNRPEVLFVDAAGLPIGLNVAASNTTIRGIAIYGFGTTPNNDNSANIFVGNVTGTLIENCVLGTTAASFTDPGAGARSLGDNLRVSGGDGGTIRNNVIGFSTGKGIQLGNGSNNWTVTGNEVRSNGIGNSNLDGIDVENNSGNDTIVGNLFVGNEAPGVDMYHSFGGNVIRNNTVTGNGVGPNANVETPGVRLYGAGNTVERNVINANFGAGVMVTTANGASTGNYITRNSIYDNGTIVNKAGAGPSNEIGIDLQSSADNELTGGPTFVTVNDNLDADAGGNNLLNFPVLSSAVISGTNITLAGFAPANAYLEFFIPTPDATGFGEGRTYLVTLQEGSASDLDATTGNYTSPFGGVNVGSETGARRFRFTLALPAGVSAGTRLTATASVASGTTYNTSEFSNNVTAALAPVVELRKCVVSGATCVEGTLSGVRPGADVTYRISITNTVAAGGLVASGVTVVDIIPPGTQFKVGSMTFAPGTTTLGSLVAQATNVSLPNPDPTQPPLPPPDTDPSWSYAPTGTYDANVKFVRWKFQSGSVASGASGTVSFTVRIP